jgi:hypothetical protein
MTSPGIEAQCLNQLRYRVRRWENNINNTKSDITISICEYGFEESDNEIMASDWLW